MRRPQESLRQAQQLYKEALYEDCLDKLCECKESFQWEDLTIEMKQSQPKLYQFILNCHLLTGHCEIKLERYRITADTCDKILQVEENYEALIIKATSLAAR